MPNNVYAFLFFKAFSFFATRRVTFFFACQKKKVTKEKKTPYESQTIFIFWLCSGRSVDGASLPQQQTCIIHDATLRAHPAHSQNMKMRLEGK